MKEKRPWQRKVRTKKPLPTQDEVKDAVARYLAAGGKITKVTLSPYDAVTDHGQYAHNFLLGGH